MTGLQFLYETAPGRCLLKPLVSRPVSQLCGRALETRASKALIPLFIRKAGIQTEECDLSEIRCFNDFFCRPLLPGKRELALDPETLMAPCDGLLTAVPIREGLVLPVKQSRYSLARLLGDRALAAEFEGGTALVFRLCVNHYHRYCYFDSGNKSANRFLPGVFHTVRPVALAQTPVFAENCREYTVLETASFGKAVQMEVGAMLVGKIVNDHPGPGEVHRGREKGHFAYGGSTIIVLLRKDAAVLRRDLLRASVFGAETPVRMGEAIGTRNKLRKEDETCSL